MREVCWVFYNGQWFIRWDKRVYTTDGSEHPYGLRAAVTDTPTLNALERQHNERVFTGPRPPIVPGIYD